MAGELAHVSVGTELTQAEFEGTTLHQFNSQAAGDIAYASSTTQISRLAKGANGDSLTLASGVPAWNTAVQSDVTASRAIDGTAYQNTSGRPLIVAICCYNNSVAAGVYGFDVDCDANATPSTMVGHWKYEGDPSGTWVAGTVTFVVLPNYYYKVDKLDTNVALDSWIEWEI